MTSATGGDSLVAMESRITTNDMLGQTGGGAPNYGMLGYRNMMLAKQAQQQLEKNLAQMRQDTNKAKKAGQIAQDFG